MMKRIKPDEIQKKLEDYLRKRNFTSDSNSYYTSLSMDKSIDLNTMMLHDLALIESTIHDYYLYSSIYSTSEDDYFKQYRTLASYIKKQPDNEEFQNLLFPLFVYLCIDLINSGHSIQNLINEYTALFGKTANSNDKKILKNLLIFNECKDLERCSEIKYWKQNKYVIKFSEKNWSKLLNYLQNTNTKLLYHIMNLYLNIIVNSKNLDYDDDYKISSDKIQSNELISIKSEPVENFNNSSIDKLLNCINKIKNSPASPNASCCYYVEDDLDCITNVNISPNLDYIASSNENSTIYLNKLKTLNKFDSIDEKHKNRCVKLFSNNNNFHELVGGHSKPVYKTQFTHDSKYLVSCGADGKVCLWDIRNNFTNLNIDKLCSPLVCTYSGHLYPVWDIDVFSTLNIFLTASKDKTARLWSFDRLYPLRTYTSHYSDVDCVAFHPNGAYLATGSSDKTLRFWSLNSADCLRLFTGHLGRIFSLRFSPDGQYLASAGEDKTIKIWDIKTGKLFKELKGHTDRIYSIEFDSSSSIICSGGLDKTVKFWNLKSDKCTNGQELFGESNELVHSINVNFNVNSIYCDLQNVFYALGVLKKSFETKNQTLSENISKISIDEPHETMQTTKISKKKISNSVVNNSTNQTPYQMSTRRSSANTSQTTINASSNLNNTSSSILFSTDDDLYEV